MPGPLEEGKGSGMLLSWSLMILKTIFLSSPSLCKATLFCSLCHQRGKMKEPAPSSELVVLMSSQDFLSTTHCDKLVVLMFSQDFLYTMTMYIALM